MEDILITGGSGFIGSNLSLALISKGCNMTILDSLSLQKPGAYSEERLPLNFSIKGNVNFIRASVLDRRKVSKSLVVQDTLVHQAAETGTRQSTYTIEKYVQVNICGTAGLLDILVNNRTHKLKKIVIAASKAIYGVDKYRADNWGIIYPEHRTTLTMDKRDINVKYPGTDKPLQPLATGKLSKIHPNCVYEITKQNQEHLIMSVCPTIGIKPVAYRYQNVYGAGQSLTNPYTGTLTGVLTVAQTLMKCYKI